MPPKRELEHEIQSLRDSPLPNIRQYIQSILESVEVNKQLQELLEQGIIRPSISPHSCLIILVTKKDKTWRMCIDYRALNKITFKNWPLALDWLFVRLVIECKVLHRVGFEIWISSSLDLKEEDTWKTTFKVKQGLNKWVSNSVWFEEYTNYFYAFNEWCVASIPIFICQSLFGWGFGLKFFLGGARVEDFPGPNKLPTRSVFDLKLTLSFNCQTRVCCCFITANCSVTSLLFCYGYIGHIG